MPHRAGHLEKATAKGRFIARMTNDLPALGALVSLMLAGAVEPTRIVENAADVLAQQVVAACAAATWRREMLLKLFRRAAGYHAFGETEFNNILGMLAGSRGATPVVYPRISFDRVNDLLLALPGSARVAMTNGGVIADTGQYAVIIDNTRRRIGELDEEFVYECKEQDRIVLGSQTWQIVAIDANTVTVTPAGAGGARVPFWRGELAPRSLLLGRAIAEFNRLLDNSTNDAAQCRAFLETQRHFDAQAGDALVQLVRRQRRASAMPHDGRIVIEHVTDDVGEPLIAVLNPLGMQVNHALRLGLEAVLARANRPVQIIHGDDGLIIRPPADGRALPEDIFSVLLGEDLEALVAEQLEQSALFGLRFRHNAARALLLPRPDPTRRTPLWQQRLRARHLLAAVRQERNFPLVLETYRECLQDVLAIGPARDLLQAIAENRVELHVARPEAPSPLAYTLLGNFQQAYQYAQDDPLGRQAHAPSVDAAAIDSLLARQGAVKQPAITWTAADVQLLARRINGADYPARTPEELLEKIAAAGPMLMGAPESAQWRSWAAEDAGAMLRQLMDTHRLIIARMPGEADSGVSESGRYWFVAAESLGLLAAAAGELPRLARFALQGDALETVNSAVFPGALLRSELTCADAQLALVQQQILRLPMVSKQDLLRRLAFLGPAFGADLRQHIDELLQRGAIVRVPEHDATFATPDNLLELKTLALRRQRGDVQTAMPADLQQHILDWQHITKPREGVDALADALDMLGGTALPPEVWTLDVLPARVADFHPSMLEALILQGHFIPVGQADGAVTFLPRHHLTQRPPFDMAALSADAQAVLQLLQQRGASLAVELEAGLPLAGARLQAALRDLFHVGLVSNDQLETILRALRTPERTAAHDGPGAPTGAAPPGRYPAAWGGGTHDVGTAFRAPHRRPRLNHMTLGGRWFLLPAAQEPAEPLAVARQATDRVHALLRRFGFACRELVRRETDGPWKICYEVLSRMEWAQVVRRGYFVEGLGGAQFAAPDVQLPPKKADRSADRGGEPLVWLSMLDPANLWARLDAAHLRPPTESGAAPEDGPAPGGIDGGSAETQSEASTDTPAQRPRGVWVAAGNYLLLQAGKPVLAAAGWGRQIIIYDETPGMRDRALAALPGLLPHLPARRRYLQVQTVNGEAVIGGRAEASLRAAGFMRGTDMLRLYRSYAVPA